jgi:hypothetical protein
MITTKVILLVLLTLCSGFSHAQLRGAIRTDFIEGYQKSCYATQRQGSPNEKLSDVTLKKYCHCAAIYVADLLNEPLMRDVEAGRARFNPIWNQMASDYCRINYERY